MTLTYLTATGAKREDNNMTIAQQYPYTVYATTPNGFRFAVASYPTRDAAELGASRHHTRFPRDTFEIVSRLRFCSECGAVQTDRHVLHVL